jgi:Cft2 family RNA processing exonuclease
MQTQFLGATGTVTGSKYLLTAGTSSVLVDCGLFQGYKQLRVRNREAFPVPPALIGAVVLRHAHRDHSGYLPVLVANGWTGTALFRTTCSALISTDPVLASWFHCSLFHARLCVVASASKPSASK